MSRTLATAAWYGDSALSLDFPTSWTVLTVWPETPPPLDEEALQKALANPVRQPRLADLATGKAKPIVIVDDLTRPTPAADVVPLILRELEVAGLAAERVSFIVGTGTHGPADHRSVVKKIGPEAAARVRIVPHDHRRNVVAVGRTSFGTRVFVNREVADSDLVLGIGGVYPQHSTGFGGGSKLALGVCGFRTIRDLHYRHPSMGGSYETENDFRRDLDEVSALIGLQTSISIHVDENRRIVRLVSGDHRAYYRDAVEFARRAYAAPPPGDADIVIANSYPIDVSLTFMRSKGIIPLLHARPGASRVIVAACPEGVGHHGLFPFIDPPRFTRERHVLRVIRARPAEVPGKVLSRARGKVVKLASRRSPETRRGGSTSRENSIWLYVPGSSPSELPDTIPGMKPVYSWTRVLEKIASEQTGRDSLKAIVYPCAPLQVLEGAAQLKRAVAPAGLE
jgi:nickel-dependent lactate racemase